MNNRAAFTRGLDELQAAMIVIPSAVFYQPKFTYIWTLGVGRFPDGLRRRLVRRGSLSDRPRRTLVARPGSPRRGPMSRFAYRIGEGVTRRRTDSRSGAVLPSGIRSGGISNESTSSGPGSVTVVVVLPSTTGLPSRPGRAV